MQKKKTKPRPGPRRTHCCCRSEACLGLSLLTVRKGRKLTPVPDGKSWLNFVNFPNAKLWEGKFKKTYSAEKQPVQIPLLGVKLEGEPTRVPDAVCGPSLAHNCGEPGEEPGFLTNLLQEVGHGQVTDVMGDFQDPIRPCPLCMNKTNIDWSGSWKCCLLGRPSYRSGILSCVMWDSVSSKLMSWTSKGPWSWPPTLTIASGLWTRFPRGTMR